jgi:L-2-hydroxyglutarate oxidase LhgO
VSDRFDLVVVGGGIVGLATALRLLRRYPALRLGVLEKEAELATHQSGHNSGVLHAGLYYTPGSLKARLCREGKTVLEAFATARGIPFARCGKIVVATEAAELGRLADLEARARVNGVDGLEVIGPERIRELEPHAVGLRGLHSPGTGIIDFRGVALAYADDIRRRGGTILCARRVTGVRHVDAGTLLVTTGGEVQARFVIACAGLHSDRVAALTESGDAELRIVPFRGDYYTLRDSARHYCRGLIYPVPDPSFPFLGVHVSRRIDGRVLCGPNAVLAFAREGYRLRTVSLRDLTEVLAFRGFRRLAGRHARTGLAEMWRGLSRRAFARAVQRYVPSIEARDLTYGPTGVRAQALDASGALVDDFVLGGTATVLHVRNAPSPGATASLAIGRVLAEQAAQRFALGPAQADDLRTDP